MTTARQANVRYQVVESDEDEEEETCLSEHRPDQDSSDNDSRLRLNIGNQSRSKYHNQNTDNDRTNQKTTRSSASDDREPIYHAADGESDSGSDYERVH